MIELLHMSGPRDGSRVGDVIFVHGLGGHPVQAWKVGQTTLSVRQLFSKNQTHTWGTWFGEDKPKICTWSQLCLCARLNAALPRYLPANNRKLLE